MPINAGPEYGMAEKRYLSAYTIEEKIVGLEEMIKYAPKHKGSENLLAGLRGRLAKLKKELKKEQQTKKKGRSFGIKKEGDAQVTILGFPNSGKSTLLDSLTNAKPKIAEYPFTTAKPELGTLDLGGIKVQLIDLPPLVEGPEYKEWLSIARVSNLIIALISSFEELTKISSYLKKENMFTEKIFVLNKIDALPKEELNKFSGLSKVLKISAKERINLEELKQKIFGNLSLIRVNTKEPGKKPTERPVVLREGADIRNMAEKIRKDYPERIKFAKVWGTSAKFPGQSVGLDHKLRDKDIVELHLK